MVNISDRHATVWECYELESSWWGSLQCGVQLWWKHCLQYRRRWQGGCLAVNTPSLLTNQAFVIELRWSIFTPSQFIQWNIHRCGVKQSEQALAQDATGPFILSGYSGYKQVSLTQLNSSQFYRTKSDLVWKSYIHFNNTLSCLFIQVQVPRGRLFAFDSEGQHVLMCSSSGGLIQRVNISSLPSLSS